MTAGTGVAAGCQESAGYGPPGLPGQMPHTRVLALPAVTPVPPAGGVDGALLRSPARAGVSDRLRSRVGGPLVPPALVHTGLSPFSGGCVVSLPLPAASGPLTSLPPLSESLHWSRGLSLPPQGRWSRVQCFPGTSSSSHTPKPCGDTPPAVLLVLLLFSQQQLHARVGSRLSLTVALPVPPVSARAEHMQGWHPARGWYRAAAWGHWCVICVMGKACPPSGMQDLACSLLCLPPLRVFGSHILRTSTARRRVGGTW